MRIKMRKAQSILEYAIVLGIVAIVLSAMSLYFRRGIQAVVRVASDELGNQKDAEEIDPLKGVKTSSAVSRQSELTQRKRIEKGGGQSSDLSAVTTASGSTASVSIREK